MAEQISMPEVYLEIRRLIDNPSANIDDYVQVVNTDPMLSKRTLNIANSPFFGFARRVENLVQALNLIGIIQLHDLLLSSLCMRAFSSIPTQILNLKAFWTYSTQCGIASRVIAQHSFAPIANHFFTLGLIHEIGHAAMYSKAPEQSLQALEDSEAQQRSIEELEREHMGFDYGQVSKALIQLWHLPEVYQQVALFHHQPHLADEKFIYEVNVVHMAHAICQNPEGGGLHRELISSVRVVDDKFKFLPDNIDDIVIKEIDAHTDQVLDILWPVGFRQ